MDRRGEGGEKDKLVKWAEKIGKFALRNMLVDFELPGLEGVEIVSRDPKHVPVVDGKRCVLAYRTTRTRDAKNACMDSPLRRPLPSLPLPLQKRRSPSSQLTRKVLIPPRNDAHRDHTLRPQRRHESRHVIVQMSRNALCECSGIDRLRYAHCAHVQCRVDRRSGEGCHLRCDGFERLDGEPEDGGDLARRRGEPGVGERRGRAHARGRVRNGGKRGAEAEYCRGFLVGEPVHIGDRKEREGGSVFVQRRRF